MTRAMLLAAGLGTRLGPIGEQRPKPLLPVCDIPILRYGIANLVASGIEDIVINLHHQGALIRRELGDGSDFGARISYIEEETILGTGGGLKNALDLLDPDGVDEPFISMNGKLIFDLDIPALLAAYNSDPEALGMMVVRRTPDALQWGALDVDTGGDKLRVRNVLGEGRHMFCGVHVTRPSVMRRLPDGEACSIRQGYLPWMKNGEPVGAFEADPAWYFAEHSNPERYLESNIALLAGTELRNPPGPATGVSPTAHLDATATIRHPVKIGPGARIGANTTIGPNSVVGEKAIVEANAVIADSVVWAKTRARGVLSRTIVTPNGPINSDGVAVEA